MGVSRTLKGRNRHWHHYFSKQSGTVCQVEIILVNDLVIPPLDRFQRETRPHVLRSVTCSRTFTANVHLNGRRQRSGFSLFT